MKEAAVTRKNRTLRAAAVLFILVLLSALFVGPLTARPTSGRQAGDSARGADFVFRVQEESGSFTIPVEINAPGEQKVYTFAVTNQDGNVVCETDQKYTIALEMEGSLPLQGTLKKNHAETPEISLDLLAPANAGNPVEASCTGNFEAAVSAEDTYELTIAWPKEGRNDPKYAGGVAEVEIKIVSVQID